MISVRPGCRCYIRSGGEPPRPEDCAVHAPPPAPQPDLLRESEEAAAAARMPPGTAGHAAGSPRRKPPEPGPHGPDVPDRVVFGRYPKALASDPDYSY